MKCQKEIRLCPNGWEDCSLCANERLCIAGLYKPETTDLDIVVLAAKIAEEVVTKEAKKSAERIMLSWTDWHDHQKQINLLSEDERWLNMFGNPAPHINYKEPLNGGSSEPGGGSKSRNKKSTKGNIPTIYMWGSTD